MLDRRYLRGAKDMREFIARELEGSGLNAASDLVRGLLCGLVHESMAADPAWTRRMVEEDVEHKRAGWRERTAKYQAKKKSRGGVK
jgi:hypothetical protein